MPEGSDYTPAPWSSGRSFSDARSAYDSTAGRSYDNAISRGLDSSDLVPSKIETDSENPIVIVFDVTGSMGDWPATIFSKLPYLDHEAKFYYGTDDYKICFAAVGDSFSDRYPLQVLPFCSGKDMEQELKKLIIEGGGGGQTNESYNLGAVYFSNNCDMPKAIRPLIIFIGDEGIYPETTQEEVEKICKISGSGKIDTAESFQKLKEKFEVYAIRKKYDGSENHRIQKQWEDYLGADHVASLQDPNRAVDVIFGILSKVTNKIDAFEKELTERQSKDKDGKDKINKVLVALTTIHRGKSSTTVKPSKSASVTRRKDSSTTKTAKSLLDE